MANGLDAFRLSRRRALVLAGLAALAAKGLGAGTSGDSGIGAATAIAFAREGADVAISYLHEEKPDAQRIIALSIRPIGRAGQRAELAPAYVFLASAESSYVIGETLSVTGGEPTP